MKAGLIINRNAWWIGVHYSPANRRLCINVLPFVTLWVTQPGGKVPDRVRRKPYPEASTL